jgi:hypothetical protein
MPLIVWLTSKVVEGGSHRFEISQVNHLGGVPNFEVNGPAKCCCLREFPQLQPVLADSNLHG